MIGFNSGIRNALHAVTCTLEITVSSAAHALLAKMKISRENTLVRLLRPSLKQKVPLNLTHLIIQRESNLQACQQIIRCMKVRQRPS